MYPMHLCNFCIQFYYKKNCTENNSLENGVHVNLTKHRKSQHTLESPELDNYTINLMIVQKRTLKIE